MARRDSSYLSEESSDASISSLSPLEPMPSRPSGRRLRLTNLFPNWRRTAPHKLPLFKEKSGILTRKLVRSAVILLLITSLALVIWLALILTVANRLRIPHLNNGLQRILETYHAPNATHAAYPLWIEEFSRGVQPVQCHSHNDYWHRIPLYEGLSAGCVGIEADIWIGNQPDGSVDLFVGHNQKSLTQSRTLETLYLDPLVDILSHQNSISPSQPNITNKSGTQASDTSSPVGVFSTSPGTSLILALDFKTDGHKTWDTVVSQLDALRARDWLTYWKPAQGVVQRPVTIVGTGSTPFDLLISNTTYRDIFYDAPLASLSDPKTPYNINNSYYASASIDSAIGTVRFGKLSGGQRDKVEQQVDRANELELESRYWDTVGWPVGWRNRVWDQLEQLGVGLLNVDDLAAATRWDWEMCVVGGVNICSS